MQLVRQPPQSNCCGQACVATIAGIDLSEAIQLCGTKGKTRTKHLIAALRAKGLKPDHGLYRRCQTCTWTAKVWARATLIVKFKSGTLSHWVVRHKGKFYDPAAGVFRDEPKCLVENGAKPVSFLIVAGRELCN